MRAHRSVVALLLAASLLISKGAAIASDHPEHPKESAAVKKVFTTDDMASAIESYVSTDAKLKGGHFLIQDGTAGILQLTLTKIHLDKLAKVGDALYFACCDFENMRPKKTYDLDFFMQEKDDQLVVSEIRVHKESGKPRYNWLEKDGVWSTVPVK